MHSGQQTAPKTLLLFAYGMFELDLLLRFREPLAKRGWSIVVITHLVSVRRRARNGGLDCVLLRPAKGRSAAPEIDLGATPEGVLGRLKPRDAETFRHSLWEGLEYVERTYSLRALVLFNGLRFAGRMAKAFADTRKLPTVFLELGNIEPKLFADPEGVNAASRLARHPEILDAYPVSDEEIAAWRESFIARKRRLSTIPQARGLLRRTNFWYPVDWLGAMLLRTPQPLPLSIGPKLAAKARQLRRFKAPAVQPAGRYLFLPLQVSEDSNLLLFSRYDNLGALAFAQAAAGERGLSLVVKPHPAELDTPLLRRIATECAAKGHILTSANTADLILDCEGVITINSTVGLEAMVMGKPVTVLGDSLYSRFSPRQAAVFAMRHLLDIQPFGDALPDPAEVDRFVALLG